MLVGWVSFDIEAHLRPGRLLRSGPAFPGALSAHPYPPIAEYIALCRSIVKQGILGNARASYWKLLIDAATRYRHAFGTAVTLAILGYHFNAVTEEACRTD